MYLNGGLRLARGKEQQGIQGWNPVPWLSKDWVFRTLELSGSGGRAPCSGGAQCAVIWITLILPGTEKGFGARQRSICWSFWTWREPAALSSSSAFCKCTQSCIYMEGVQLNSFFLYTQNNSAHRNAGKGKRALGLAQETWTPVAEPCPMCKTKLFFVSGCTLPVVKAARVILLYTAEHPKAGMALTARVNGVNCWNSKWFQELRVNCGSLVFTTFFLPGILMPNIWLMFLEPPFWPTLLWIWLSSSLFSVPQHTGFPLELLPCVSLRGLWPVQAPRRTKLSSF